VGGASFFMVLRSMTCIKALFYSEIIFDKLVEKLVAVDVTDECARIFVVGDIGRVLGKQISHNLINGVVSLFAERDIDLSQDLLGFDLLVLHDGKGLGLSAVIEHNDLLL